MSINFKNAYLELCQCLSMEPTTVKEEKISNENEERYTARGLSESYKFTFDLYLSINREPEDNRVSLTIYPVTGTQPFSISDKLRNTGNLEKYIEKWTSWAVFNFNLQYRPISLNGLFQYVMIKVYGYPFFTHPAILELDVFLNGIVKVLNKLVIFRFRHVLEGNQVADEDDYRSLFSYAFLISDSDSSNGDPAWIFFPNIAGKESGKKVDDVEKSISLLSRNIRTIRKYYDIRMEEC